MKNKKNRSACSFVLYHLNFQKKNRNCIWKNTWVNLKKFLEKMASGMINFIPYNHKKTFGQFSKMRKLKWIIDLFLKIKKS